MSAPVRTTYLVIVSKIMAYYIPGTKNIGGYIVFAFSVIMFICLSVCLFVCKLFFSSKISQQLLGLGF